MSNICSNRHFQLNLIQSANFSLLIILLTFIEDECVEPLSIKLDFSENGSYISRGYKLGAIRPYPHLWCVCLISNKSAGSSKIFWKKMWLLNCSFCPLRGQRGNRYILGIFWGGATSTGYNVYVMVKDYSMLQKVK